MHLWRNADKPLISVPCGSSGLWNCCKQAKISRNQSSFDKTTSSATFRHHEKTKRRTDANYIQTKELHKGHGRQNGHKQEAN